MDINITIVGQLISFIIFVFFCMKYIWVPMISIIEKRQKEISDIFASAEHAKKTSEIARIEALNFLEESKIEAQLIVERANQYKIQMLDQAKYEAQIEREKILFQTKQDLCIERKCVFEELQKEMGLMIILGVEKIIGSSINKNVNRDIIDNILNDFKKISIPKL